MVDRRLDDDAVFGDYTRQAAVDESCGGTVVLEEILGAVAGVAGEPGDGIGGFGSGGGTGSGRFRSESNYDVSLASQQSQPVYEARRPEPFGRRGRNELGWNGVGEERSDSELEEGNGKGRESQINEKKKPAGLMCQDTSDNLASDRTRSQASGSGSRFFPATASEEL